MFSHFFNTNDTLAEWARKALVVETFYNIIREELRLPHVRIGTHTEESPKKVKPARTEVGVPKKPGKKTLKPTAGFDFNSMAAEFKSKLEAEVSGKRNL